MAQSDTWRLHGDHDRQSETGCKKTADAILRLTPAGSAQPYFVVSAERFGMFAMNNLLKERNNVFYHDYNVVVCAGAGAGIGADALPPVLKAMENQVHWRRRR
jgi:hypothetical protein